MLPRAAEGRVRVQVRRGCPQGPERHLAGRALLSKFASLL
jgi:hypothetical protein